MIWSMKRFKQSFKYMPQVIKNAAVGLLPLSMVVWILEYVMSDMQRSRFQSPADDSTVTMIVFGLVATVIQCLVVVAWLIIVARSTQQVVKGEKVDPWSFLFKHYHQSLIEYVRAIISIGLWGLLLIVPGVIRWIQLTFTVMISLFDPQYHQGQVDALKKSTSIANNYWIPLFFLLLFQGLLPSVFEKIAWEIGNPFFGIGLFYLVAWACSIWLAIYTTLTYFTVVGQDKAYE